MAASVVMTVAPDAMPLSAPIVASPSNAPTTPLLVTHDFAVARRWVGNISVVRAFSAMITPDSHSVIKAKAGTSHSV